MDICVIMEGKPNLKKRISRFLEAREKTFGDLARYLTMSEKDLEDAIESTTLNVRILEDISKALRIPLYSFFNFPKIHHTDFLNFYTEHLPEDDSPIHVADKKEKLEKEINMLKYELQRREKLLQSLK